MEKASPTIIYILSPPPTTPSSRMMIGKEENKNQLPPGSFPSSSVPSNSGSQGGGISPTRPSCQWTPAGSPTSRIFMRLWEGTQN